MDRPRRKLRSGVGFVPLVGQFGNGCHDPALLALAVAHDAVAAIFLGCIERAIGACEQLAIAFPPTVPT